MRCREDVLSSMLPIYQELLAARVKMLVYSGDVDAIVPGGGQRSRVHPCKAAAPPQRESNAARPPPHARLRLLLLHRACPSAQ